jgi:hypothetical protein
MAVTPCCTSTGLDCPNGKNMTALDCSQLSACMQEFINRNKREPGNNGGGRHGLKNRYDEQVNGKCGPGTKSWDDHDQQYRGLWEKLHSYIQEFYERTNPPCVNLPGEISEWAMKEPPKPSDWKGDPKAPVDPKCNGEEVPVPPPVVSKQPETDTEKEKEKDNQADPAPDSGITVDDVAHALDAAAKVTAVVLVGGALIGAAILLAPEVAVAGAVAAGIGAIVITSDSKDSPQEPDGA